MINRVRIFAFAGLLLILTACNGPSPRIVNQSLQPPQSSDGPYTLVLTIQNQGSGEGEAVVTARLVANGSGETAAQGDQTVDLKPHETVQVLMQLQPPQPGEYQATSEVQYPPE